MSALRNYRRSLSERRESLSEMGQQDGKRLSEIANAAASAETPKRTVDARRDLSSEDEDDGDYSPVNESKPKSPQRKFSLDFIFSRKNSKPEKKKNRSFSTSAGPAPQSTFQGVSSV